MTRKITIGMVVAVACAGILSPAHAAPFPLNGTVAPHCSLGASSGPLTINTTVPADGKLDPALNGRTFSLTGVFCDAPSTIHLSATALRRSPPKTSVLNGQSQAANYTATATGWTTTAASVMTSETSPLGSTTVFTGSPRSQNTAKAGSITLTVTNFTTVVGDKGLGQKLVDGAYSATITISLTPGS